MIFRPEWDAAERIALLERWILVQSFAYYELNENVASDFQYDGNVQQLFRLLKDHPEEHRQSPYYEFFRNFEPGCTSGFELIGSVARKNQALYNHLRMDANLALDAKGRHCHG